MQDLLSFPIFFRFIKNSLGINLGSKSEKTKSYNVQAQQIIRCSYKKSVHWNNEPYYFDFDLIGYFSKFHYITINTIISTTQTAKHNTTIHNIEYCLIYMEMEFLKGGLLQ